MRRKFLLSWFLMLLLITGNSSILNADEVKVAKVGDIEYATIDEAIANWTNNKTLTLLDDVTLSDVVTIKSTEHHILNLGTYTMTAASGKNAFVIQACGTGSAERSAITINADAANPGGINAGSKCVIYYKYADGGISAEDRPIIKINGGVFTGSTSSWGTAGIYTIGTAARKCATLNISGGTFNCSINGSGKSKLIVSGGVFNHSVGSQGDQTCYRLISGGTFKSFGFMTADDNNTKFWIGTSMGNSNVGAYIDDKGYLVVGGPVVTEPGTNFEASSPNHSYAGFGNYLTYSSVATNGIYYTSVEEALTDNNKTDGSVTVYVDELDMADFSSYKGTIVVPADYAITITNAPANLNVVDEGGNAISPNANGTYTTVTPQGNDFTGYTRTDAIWGEVWGNAYKSFVIKVLDANGNEMGTTSLNNIGGIIDGDVGVTWHITLPGITDEDQYWIQEWTTVPTIDNMPAKVELWVDGVKVSGGDVVLNAPDNLNPIYAAVTDADGKILSYHTSIANAVAAIPNTRSNPQGYIALLRDTDEAITLPAGITLNLNGHDAPNVSVPVAQIGDQTFTTLEAAFEAATEGQTITLLADATPALTSQRAITKAAVIDLGGKTLTLTEDDLYFGTTEFKNGIIIVDPSVSPSTAVFWMFANQTLTFDNVKLTATDVTGTYLIGLDGNNSDLNILNGSEIIVNNATALDLDIICVNASTGNDIVVDNSKVNVKNLDGRVFFRGNYTIKGNSDIDLDGITKAGFRIEAGQTLSIEDNATVDIIGEPRDGGIHLTDLTATYTVAETATVNATVNQPVAVAQIGTTKYGTLQAAIDAVQNGETIELLSDVTEVLVNIEKASGVAFTIDGKNNEFTGEFEIGIGESINIKNIDFVASAEISPDYFIDCMDKNSNCVLTITGCTFTDTDYSTTAMGTHQPTNVVIDGCTAAGVASLLQNQGGYNITVKNTTVEGKRGISLGTVVGATVENVTINAADDKYGIRLNGEITNNTITIKDCNITAFIPVVVRKALVENYNVIFNGTNTMTASNTDGLWCAIGTSEYETNGTMPTAPTGQVTVTLNDTGLSMDGVYGAYVPVAQIGTTKYGKLAEAVAAVQEGQTIQLLAGEISEGTIKLPATLKNVTFKGAADHASVLKDMTIMAADGNSFNYEGLTFDGIYFNNSRISLTGWRNGDETIKDLTVTNCWFKNLDDTTNSAPLHINKDASEAVNGLKFTDNVIDGATGGSKSGVYAQTTGVVIFTGNIINNVAFRPYVIQLTTDDGIADNFTVTGNTFSGSAAGRAQGLGNNAEGTDAVSLTISNNIFEDITNAQQICYWNFNEAKTTAVLEKNYYDIDIVANPSMIYFNNAAADKYELSEMGVFPIYTELNEDGTINTASAYTPELPIAQIGETGYATLAEAAADAQAGDEIKLLTDATVEGTLALPAGIKLTSNGHTINGSIRMLGDLELNGPLTITGGLWVGKGGETLTATLSGGKLTASYFMFQHGTYTINADIDAVYGYLSFGGTFEVNSTIHTTGANGEVLYINGNVTLNDGAVLDSDNSVFVCNDNAVLTLKPGSKVDSNVKITESGAKLIIDATGMAAGESANITGTVTNSGNGTIAVVGNDNLEAKIIDGKIVLVEKPVAKIGDVEYTTLEDAFKAATSGSVIEILSDVTVDYAWDCRNTGSKFTVPVTIKGNDKTIKFTGAIEDKNWNTVFRFEEEATVNNLTVNIEGATTVQRVITAKKSLNVDDLIIVGSSKYGIIFGEGASAEDLAATEIVIKNSALNGTRRAVSDNEGGKDVKSVVIEGNNLTANVYVSASESIVFNNNTTTSEVDLRSYAADNVLSVVAKDNELNEEVKNYIYAKNIDAQEEFTTENPPLKVADKDELNAAIAAAKEGNVITLTADIDYGTDQLKIEKAITLDLGGKTLTTRNAYGGMSIKNNPTVKNGNIVHASNTAAIKVWNATAFEDLVIDVQGKGDANKTIGGIVLQEGSTTCVGSIKNVTIKGEALTNGIETYNCGNATENVIGSMENVVINAVGTAMKISAPCGTATDCSFNGGDTGIELWIKGTYSASLDLVECEVSGGKKSVYIHDEFNSNPVVNTGDLKLTADDATTFESESGAPIALTIAHTEGEIDYTLIYKLIETTVAKVNDVYYTTLQAAIDVAQTGDVVKVFEGEYSVPSMKAGITIEGVVEGEGEVLFKGTLSGTLENLTLKNIHIQDANAQRWAYAKGNLVFENVIFEATSVYAIHFDGITEGTNLLYKNCTIIGWAAMGGSPASCKFEGCTIKDNGTYGVIRTYFDATIEECIFDIANVNTTDIYQDGIHAVSGANVIVTNCTNKNGDMIDVINVGDTSVVVLDGDEIKNVVKVAKKDENPKYYRTLPEAFAAAGDGSNTTVTLLANVDLDGAEWTPVNFYGVFDGQNYTISNLVINGAGKSNQGFFGQTQNGEIKNVTFNNAKVSGRLNVGVVAGTPYTSKYTNINVIGHVEVNGMAYVGGVGGKNAYANWTDITVNVDGTSYVKANSVENGTAYRTYVGGVVGFNGEGSHTFKNITSNIKVIGSTCDIGGIFGIAHYGNKVENVSCSAIVESTGEADELGGIAGVWHNQKGTSVTMNNVTFTGKVYDVNGEVEGVDIVGGAYNADNETADNSGSLIINGNEAWLKVAQVGEEKYLTLAAAVEAAEAAEASVTITLLADVTESAILPAGITFNGNGKSVIGTITAGGNLTFMGVTTVEGFSAGYYNHTINIGEGASLKVTTNRLTVSYGNVFNITGSIENAKTADKSNITPSLILTAGASFNGDGGGVNFNVNNAYVVIGDASTKNSGATGEFNLNFNNSIVDFTKTLKTYEPTESGLNPVVNINMDNSVVSFASHLELWRSATDFTLDNSNLTVGGSFANAGVVTVKNGANFVVNAPIMSSHGGNTGTIVADGGTFELKDSNQDWENAGTMKVTATGKFITNDFKCVGEGKMIVDAATLENFATATVIDGNGVYNFEGVTTLENANGVTASYEDGDVTITRTYVAKIGDTYYATLAEAVTAAENDATIELIWAEGKAPIAMNASLYGKNVTITGTAKVDWSKGWLYVAYQGADATLTFENAKLTSASNSSSYGINVSGAKSNNSTNNGTVILKDSEIELDYLMNRYQMTLNKSTLTVKNGFAITARPATEGPEGVVAEMHLTNYSKVVVDNMNGMGIGHEAYGTMNIDATSTFETKRNFDILANGTMNNNGGNITINGTLTVNGNLNSSGNITGNITKADAATIILTGGTYTQDVNEWCHADYDAIYNGNNTWTVIQTSGTQIREFATPGWYWFSTYINLEGENGLNTLKASLGGNATQIKGQEGFTDYYNVGGGAWTSGLSSISAADMYMIKTKSPVTIELTGDFVEYEQFEIDLKEGWNWLGFPLSKEVNINDAFAKVNLQDGDEIKGKNNDEPASRYYVDFDLGNGETYTGWDPAFDMKPGHGYMFKSVNEKTFVYSANSTRSSDSGLKTINYNGENHWFADATKYPNNMSVVAMLSIDGEIVKDNYEIAAFANGECRGSARPYYVEALDSYVLYMTIHGEDVENLTFKYYDVNYGTEYDLNNTMVYSNDASIGSLREPYMFNLGILNIEETSVDQISIYPNPTTTGKEINLQAVCDKVEVFNALGVKVAEYTNVDSIDALETAGIYVIRVTIDGNARNCRLIVK